MLLKLSAIHHGIKVLLEWNSPLAKIWEQSRRVLFIKIALRFAVYFSTLLVMAFRMTVRTSPLVMNDLQPRSHS